MLHAASIDPRASKAALFKRRSHLLETFFQLCPRECPASRTDQRAPLARLTRLRGFVCAQYCVLCPLMCLFFSVFSLLFIPLFSSTALQSLSFVLSSFVFEPAVALHHSPLFAHLSLRYYTSVSPLSDPTLAPRPLLGSIPPLALSSTSASLLRLSSTPDRPFLCQLHTSFRFNIHFPPHRYQDHNTPSSGLIFTMSKRAASPSPLDVPLHVQKKTTTETHIGDGHPDATVAHDHAIGMSLCFVHR